MSVHSHAIVVPTWLALALTLVGLMASGVNYWHTSNESVAVDIATLKVQVSALAQQATATDAKVDRLIDGLLK